MNRWLTLSGGFVAIALLSTGLAFGQQPKPDCKAGAPEKVEGQVVRVDPASNKVTIRDKSGVDSRVPGEQGNDEGHEAGRPDRSEAPRSAEVLS